MRLDADPLELGQRYSVFGRAVDEFGNERAILIPFVSQAIDFAAGFAVVEIQEFFDSFATLLESVDMENIEAIEVLFSETYVAADDPATLSPGLWDYSGKLCGWCSGNDPTFEEYVSLQFLFQDIEMDIMHARKAAVTLQLDVNAEKGKKTDLREFKASCKFEFRREATDWK